MPIQLATPHTTRERETMKDHYTDECTCDCHNAHDGKEAAAAAATTTTTTATTTATWPINKSSATRCWKNVTIVVLATALAALLTANVLYLTRRPYHNSGGGGSLTHLYDSASTGKSDDTSFPGYASWGADRPFVDLIEGYRNAIYTSENRSEADAVWSRANPGHGVVVLDNKYAADVLGLPPGYPWDWDANKSIYYIAAYHVMHCVIFIRQALVAGFTGDMSDYQKKHSMHCIATLREEAMCTADRTLLTPGPPGHSGKGLVRHCTDWSQLRAWATENSAGFVPTHDGSLILNTNFPDTDGWVTR